MRIHRCACTACAVASFFPAAAVAQGTFLAGIVADPGGRPVSGATVRLVGGNVTLVRMTDQQGGFAFPALVVGRYRLTVVKGSESLERMVEVTSPGVVLRVSLGPVQTIGSVTVTRNPQQRRSGTDVGIDAQQIARFATGSSLSGILAQMPSAASASNGQVHVNGNHNGLNYYLDGVQLPASLNRVLGNEIPPNDIGYLDMLEGAYPAQYGEKFAAVLDIGTKTQAGPAGLDFGASGGSFGSAGSTLSVHEPLGNGGGLSLSTFAQRTDWGLDPPVPDPVHDASSAAGQLLRVSLPVNGGDRIDLDAMHSLQTFQIPPDTALGVPSWTDDDEYQSDTFVALQYRHAIGDDGVLQFGPSLKISNILDTNDLAGDLAPGGPPPPPGQINCIDFTNCVFSAYADAAARDLRFNVDYARKTGRHEVRAGALYDATNVSKDYVITMQPYSALNPNGAFTATDTSPNVAHQQEEYLQDAWALGPQYELDYGLRADAFQIFSTNFHQGFSQISPRIKLTRLLGSRASVYAYYGRLFVPFSFENVNPATAAQLYYAPPPQTFDLRPERDSLYEVGGHAPIGSADLGFRVMHQVATDWIDDTQVGATNLHQDINFPSGRIDAQSLYLQQNLPRDGRLYASLTHSTALNSLICETNLLQNCTLGGYVRSPGGALVPYYVSPGGGLVEADHDQHWDATAGWLRNDRRGGWFSLNAEYGSGLSHG